MKTRPRRHFGYYLNIAILLLIAILMTYPLWYVFMFSVSSRGAVSSGELLLYPKQFTLNNLRFVLSSPEVRDAYYTTFLVVVPGTIMSLIVTALLSYPLSTRIPGVPLISLLAYITIVFHGGIIPTFVIVKATGLLDTRWSLILPQLVNPFYIFIMVKFFRQIPASLSESANMDGASDFTIMFRIMLPLSLPVLATISLFYAVRYWNSFFDAVIYISDPKKRPLQVLLRNLLIIDEHDPVGASTSKERAGITREGIKMTTTVVTVVPILLVYPFLQKYFVKGLMIGAVKG